MTALAAATIVGALDLLKRGAEFVGPCPNCRDGRDRFHVLGDGVFGCRVCGEHDNAGLYRAVMEACGETGNTWRPAPVTTRKAATIDAGPGLRGVDASRAAITLQATFDEDGAATGPALYVAKANYASAGRSIPLFDVKLSNGAPVAFAALDNNNNGGRSGEGRYS